MNRTVKLWLHGLGAAMIGGGASAVVGSSAVNMVDPDHFNLSDHAGVVKMFTLLITLFLANGFLSAMAYLKQSPLPPETVILPDPPEQANSAGVGK